MKFHLVQLGSRPLLAVPRDLDGSGSLWAAAIDCYPAHTRKKRVVRQVLHGLARIGLTRWFFPARPLSLPGLGSVDFEAWMGMLCEQLREAKLHPLLVWPADPLRGRVYIYLLNPKGEKVGFCKLGLDGKNNALIERERQALERLLPMELKLSRIPKLLAHGYLNGELGGEIDGEFEGGFYLMVEITPTDTRIVDWQNDPSIEENIAEYAGSRRILDRAEVESLRWWPEVKRQLADYPALNDEVIAALDHGVEVCLAHGDLNCTNVLRANDGVWLLDWEQSDANAPSLTDQVCVVVDQLWLANSQDPAGDLRQFMDAFPEQDGESTRAKLIMALAYLGAAGFPPALAMIDAWGWGGLV